MLTAGRMPISRSVGSANSAIISKTRHASLPDHAFSISSGARGLGILSALFIVVGCLGRRARPRGMRAVKAENPLRGRASRSHSADAAENFAQMKTLLLVDASSYLYRAFHA